MISLKELLETIAKWTPIKINIDKSQHIESLRIWDNNLKVENGFITLGDGTKIKLQRNKKGELSFFKDGTELKSVYGKDKKENVKLLDKQKDVYSRADISDAQLEFLSVEKRHEIIISKFKPILEDYRMGWDMASLLVASTIIKLEESPQKNKNMVMRYNKDLNESYGNIGRMIYNLFRSGVLEKEILPYLEDLKRRYDKEGKSKFLSYWYGIIKEGYPTAYFMTYDDMFNPINLIKGLNWRFDRGSDYVEVYSRGKVRNQKTIELCEKYCVENQQFKFKVSKPYQLGYTTAITVTIERR